MRRGTISREYIMVNQYPDSTDFHLSHTCPGSKILSYFGTSDRKFPPSSRTLELIPVTLNTNYFVLLCQLSMLGSPYPLLFQYTICEECKSYDWYHLSQFEGCSAAPSMLLHPSPTFLVTIKIPCRCDLHIMGAHSDIVI